MRNKDTGLKTSVPPPGIHQESIDPMVRTCVSPFKNEAILILLVIGPPVKVLIVSTALQPVVEPAQDITLLLLRQARELAFGVNFLLPGT
jgi:hypothetical protein